MKKCKYCKKDLPLDSFFANPTSKDGYFYTCKQCINIKRRTKPPLTHPEGEKECSNCNESKPFNKFNKDRSKADGYNIKCKECIRVYRQRYSKKHTKEINYAEFYYPVNLD